MRRIPLVIIPIVLFIVIQPFTREEIVEDLESSTTTFSLGERNPAGKINHEFKGKLPKTQAALASKDSSSLTLQNNLKGDFDDPGPNNKKRSKINHSASVWYPPYLPNRLTINPLEMLIDPALNQGANLPNGPQTTTFSNTPFWGSAPSSGTSPLPSGNENLSRPTKKPLVISGIVKPLVGNIVSISPWANAFTAWAASSCIRPKVGIYKTSELLNLGALALKEVSLKEDASFTFHPDAQIDTSRPQDYSLQVTGCDSYLSRIVTGFDNNQDINLVSTLLSFSQVSPVNISPTQIHNKDFKILIELLEKQVGSSSSIIDVFNTLNHGVISDKFADLFRGSGPEQLRLSLPVIKEIVIPEAFTEGSAAILRVDSMHWHPDYQTGIEWYLDGVSTSFGTLWNWTPPGNSRREVKISVRIGVKKTDENHVDTTYPYHQLNFSRSVINAIQPIAPSLELDSSIPHLFNNPNIPIIINTGVDFIHCDSFSKLAITESPEVPLTNEFNIICSQEEFQLHTFSLNTNNSSDGTKHLYLWAKDDLDEISAVPSILSLVLDQSPPILSLAPLNATYGGNTDIDISWTVTEQNAVSTQDFSIEFFNGSQWVSLPNIKPLSGVLDNVTLSTSQLLPDLDASNARFRLTYSDALGQTSSVTSNTFNIRVPVMTSSPLSHNFGDIAAQSISTPITFTFSNSGEWPTVACNNPILTEDSTQFSIVAEDCSESSLDALGGSCSVTVRANPSLRGSYNSFLNLTCGTKNASATLTVTGQNNPPLLASSFVTTLNEDTPHHFSLNAGTDLDGDALTYTIISGPTQGSISSCLNETNNLNCTYTPASNYFGSDSFTFHAYDGFNYSSPQTVSLTINPVNDRPIIDITQSLTTNEDAAVSFTLNEATDVENDDLSYDIVSLPSQGSLTCNERNCTYTPPVNYHGVTTFTYKANDGSLDSAIVTATITITPINDIPVPGSDFTLTVIEDSPTHFNLAPGTDVDLPTEPLKYEIESAPTKGVLSGCFEIQPSVELSCIYTPNTDDSGSDSFTYRVCDAFVCSSAVTTVSITITPVNDAPVMISDQNFNLDDTELIDLLLNGAIDVDIPTQTLSYQIVSSPSQGTLTGCINTTSWSSGLNCRFTPPSNFNGSISFTYRASDGELQSTNISTVTFNISDKTPSPIPDITLASAYYTNLTNVSVTIADCTDIDALYISSNSSTPMASQSGWVPCTTAVGALSTTISPTNGPHSIYVWSKDQIGNVQMTPDSVEVIFDNIPPSINIFTKTLLGNSTEKVFFDVTELNVSSTQDFRIRYHNGSAWSSWNIPSPEGPYASNRFSTDVSVPDSNGSTLNFEIKYNDAAGNEGTQTATILTDQTLPKVTAFSLNGGVSKASNNNLSVYLAAEDDISNVRYYCLKYNDTTKPSADSSCWKDVIAPIPGIVASQNITFNNAYFQIGFIKSSYQVSAWVKDEVGLISENSFSINDTFLIDYDPGSPPRLLSIEAVNSGTPNRPNLTEDLIIALNQNVYIKWRAEDTEGFATDPISIEYSLNDVDFIPIAGFQQLANSANGACTVDLDFTGCVVVPSPSNNYFKIRVIAKDNADTTVYLNSEPLNNSKLRIVAGNTEHGLEGSAMTAIYYNYGSAGNVSYQTKNKLAVSEDGKFFYLDPMRGLLWIDPSTGSLQVFIKTTGISAGDGGNITSATLTSPRAITLDAYNRLLIWDNDRIRRVNLANMTISSVIGGGAVSSPTTVVSAASLNLGNFDNMWGSLIPLPNGDIIFNPETSTRNPYRYRASDQMVEPMILNGQGFDGDAGANWDYYTPLDFAIAYNTTTSDISFMTKGFYRWYIGDSFSHYVRILPTGNATTPYHSTAPYDLGFQAHSLVTALDGKLYLVDRFRRQIIQYDPTTNSRTPIVGHTSNGTSLCAENTPALSCPMDIDTLFIGKNGRVYFVDQGVIRTVDDSNNVITLFGQHRGYGDGQLASVTRFGNIVDLKFGKHSSQNDLLIVSDAFSGQYREFQIYGLTTDLGSNGYGWSGPFRFETDPVTGDVMAPREGVLQRLIRATNTWTTIVGNGGTHYTQADGLTGSQIYFGAYPIHTSGFVDGKLYYRTYYWTGTQSQACQIKAYDANDSYRQSHFMGTPNNNCNGSYSPGANLADQNIGTSHITSLVDPTDGQKKIFFSGPNGAINRVSQSNILEEFVKLPRAFTNFSHRYAENGLDIYYCSDGNLYHYNYTNEYETHLSWPSATIKCKGQTLYNPERKTIVFSFTQNGLDGVAEYQLD